MADSLVCSGATMKCTMGTSQAKLTVLPTRTVFLTGKPQANISDHLSMVNLAPFGNCRSMAFPATASATAAAQGTLTPMPCMHNTPFPWMGGKNDYIIKGDPALLKSSTCQCMWGGTISLVTDGQSDTGAADLSRKPSVPYAIRQENKQKAHVGGGKTSLSQSNSRQLHSSNNLFAKGLEGIKQDAKDLWTEISSEFGELWNNVSDRVNGLIKNISDKIDRKKYIKSIIKNNLKYNPEQPDIVLSQSLRSWFAEADVENSMKRMSIDEKKNYIQNTLRPKLNQIMGLNLPEYEWFDSNDSTSFGYYSFNKRSLSINSDYLKSNDDRTIALLLNTILHESKHARQFDAVTGQSDFGYSQELLESWWNNMNNYISYEESDEGYMKQPIELDAWMFSEEIIYDGLINLNDYK